MSSTRQIKISLVQSGGLTGNREDDLYRLLSLFAQAAQPGTDLVVFPELCTTPYFGATGNDDYTSWAQQVDGPAVSSFASTARKLGCAVVFGFYELGEDGRCYNSAVLIDGEGNLVQGTNLDGETVRTYRKTSIPQGLVADVFVDEKQFFAEGTGPAVFDVAGTRIAPLICYDRTFPEYWLGARALGAEVVVPLVSSLGTREQLFVQELQIRAMETQTWVVAANRGGKETIDGCTVSYFGLSCVIDPRGEVVTSLPAHQHDDIAGAVLDLELVDATRSAFPLGRDRTPAFLGKIEHVMVAGIPAAVDA